MRKLFALTSALLLFFLPLDSWARGGGGCVAEGTMILTPEGSVPVETLRVGDGIWALLDGKLQEARVRALRAVHPDEFLEISAEGRTLRVTPEHPVMAGPGEYRTADLLRSSDTAYLLEAGALKRVTIHWTRRLLADRPAYNLLVHPGGTFVSGGFVVHNKGCFLPDTPILRPDGSESSVSALRAGDELLAYTPEGRMLRTRVREIIRHDVDEYVLLKTDRTTLRATAEHPFYVGHGTFKTVEALKAGEAVFAWDGQSLAEQRVVSLHRVRERVSVFNLQTDHPNTFFAGRLAVHNKGGGCFPPGTRISTPLGPVPIEGLTSGDEVLAVTQDGQTVRARVRGVFVSKSPVLRVTTDEGTFTATEEHPVALWEGGFRLAGNLRPGDRILKWRGGRFVTGTVRGLGAARNDGVVFNLQVAEPHTFVAEGIVVHNKGGGSSRSSSSSRSSGGGSSSGSSFVGFIVFFFILFVFVLIIVALAKAKKTGKGENLDYVYGRDKVERKAKKTEKLLAFLGQQDSTVTAEALRKLAESTFRKLQQCWESRDYKPMATLLMPALYAQHTTQLQGMVRNHEINRIENLKVEQVDLVHIRYTEKQDQRQFTALITASARDYYVDDRSGTFLRGDSGPARFQEFWTFHRFGDGWLLREIEQAGESDVLKDENFVEMLTDQTLKGVYSEAAAQGTAGPWLEKGAEEKATRTERLLNFLVQTDKLWDRRQMLERARQVFLGVYLARESGNPAQVPVGDLFPGMATGLKDQIRHWQRDGVTVQYRNLCVRKAELILVRNFSDRSKDEFTVRIDAHAQKIARRGDKAVSEQPYVTPFEEYWTFGRLDEQWKLKEVLPPAMGKKRLAQENVDEESSPGQLEWFYRQTRAQ